jgi:hypothetical protein
MNRLETDFLCAQSSFLMGLGSVLNLDGRSYYYNVSADPDGIAVAHDWSMVGQDLRDALGKVDAESNAESDATRKPVGAACG